MKILIADDDDAWIRVLARYFAPPGYEVLWAGTWAEAGVLAERQLPDVVLVDATLPDGDAAGFCATLRADSRFDRTALIMVSGNEGAAADCPADRFVLKGRPLKELEDLLPEALKELRSR